MTTADNDNENALTALSQQEQPETCPATANETVCVSANVTITPTVDIGGIESFCVDDPIIGSCPGTPSMTGSCSFTVNSIICVQIPLTFSATAAAEPIGITCSLPVIGPCTNISCTHTIGFYRTHPDETNALIGLAGGTIILGVDGGGASFAVTAANANAVLTFKTPSPPAPALEPLAQQYQSLYAQLLAANLNILSGASCAFALQAISDANEFLRTSISGVGKPGAPIVQQPLEQFNAGNAPGCPGHCQETTPLC